MNNNPIGITGIEHQWFRNYLTGWSQLVIVSEHLSNPLPLTVGVPQRSIRGPLLFLLFLNDLPAVMETCSTNMFADDTEIEDTCKPEEHSTLENNIKSDLSRIKLYFDTNRLSINVTKCEFMQIDTYQSIAKMPNLMFHINNEPLKKVSIAKYLGMYIDENLKLDEHINVMIPKISAKIGILRSLRRIIPINTIKLLYNAIILLHFDYSNMVYYSASETSKLRLQKLQTWETKLISGSGPGESRNPIFKELGWLSLQNRRAFHKCIMVFKCRNSIAPEYLAELFSSNDTVHMYNTRNASQLRATRTRTAHYHRCFTVSESNL